MRYLLPTGLIALSLCYTAAAYALVSLSTYSATYSVSWRGLTAGQSTHTLTQIAPDQYQFTAVTEPRISFFPYHDFGQTTFTVTDASIHPMHYRFKKRRPFGRSAGELIFDWGAMQVMNKVGSYPWSLDIKADTQDKLSHTLLMRQEIASGKTHMSYPIADGGYVKPFEFEVVGEESLDTELGTLKTVKVIHRRNKRATTVWLAKEHNYLLVKIVQSRKGKTVGSGTIQSVEWTTGTALVE